MIEFDVVSVQFYHSLFLNLLWSYLDPSSDLVAIEEFNSPTAPSCLVFFVWNLLSFIWWFAFCQLMWAFEELFKWSCMLWTHLRFHLKPSHSFCFPLLILSFKHSSFTSSPNFLFALQSTYVCHSFLFV